MYYVGFAHVLRIHLRLLGPTGKPKQNNKEADGKVGLFVTIALKIYGAGVVTAPGSAVGGACRKSSRFFSTKFLAVNSAMRT